MLACLYCEADLKHANPSKDEEYLCVCTSCAGVMIGGPDKNQLRIAGIKDLESLKDESAKELFILVTNVVSAIKESRGHVDPERFLINTYVCQKCGRSALTVDVDAGVTPFIVSCSKFYPEDIVNCTGLAQSMLYKFDHLLEPEMCVAPDFEWYRPGPQEVVPPEVLTHVTKRGLLLRGRTKAAPWPRTPKEGLN